MTAEEQKRYINYLAERVREADLGLRARDAVLQDFLDKQKEYDERLSKLNEVLSKVSFLEKSLKEKERKLKSAERKVADLTVKLKFADKNRFGDKRQKEKTWESTKAEESDRGKDEDDFDGTFPKAGGPEFVTKFEGAKMAATYHSIISTVKPQGRSAWDYLGKFFVNIFNGCRDFCNYSAKGHSGVSSLK